MVFPLGPVVNAALVIAGALTGMALGNRFPERIRQTVFQCLGLCTLLIGLQMALGTTQPLLIVASMLSGGICGELLRLEDRFQHFGDWLKVHLKSANPRFTEGFVSATLMFCVGAMAILGSFEEGLQGGRTLVFSKSLMDAFAAMAMAAAFGLGVAFAALPVLIYQGLLVIFAAALQPWLDEHTMRELSAVGGLLIMCIGLNLLSLVTIRLLNLVPALIAVVALVRLF